MASLRPHRRVDFPQRTHDNALWHIYGLAPGTHTVRLATTGAADQRSTGTTVLVRGANLQSR